jgi:hypothetical protein
MATTILAGLAMVPVVLLLWYWCHSLLAGKTKSVVAGGPEVPRAPGTGQPPRGASERQPAGAAPERRPAGLALAAGSTGYVEVSGLTKAQAEQLLDWLEANGYQACGLSAPTPDGYTVRYRKPPA